MPFIRLNIIILRHTIKTIKNINGKSHLDFYIKENLGDREPCKFWVDAFHDSNLKYLANKTNLINQFMKSTTAMLVGIIAW